MEGEQQTKGEAQDRASSQGAREERTSAGASCPVGSGGRIMQLIGLTLFVAGLGTAAAIYWFKQDLAAAIVVAMLGTFLGARFAGLIGGG